MQLDLNGLFSYLCSEDAVLDLKLQFALKEINGLKIGPNIDVLQHCIGRVESLTNVHSKKVTFMVIILSRLLKKTFAMYFEPQLMISLFLQGLICLIEC